ncbi:MAG: CpXC domain-containing protein, partial [Chloroflexota bacterium]
MAVSQAKRLEIACPECQTSFAVEAWTIVDVWERPDLVYRLQRGVLHFYRCPRCQTQSSFDSPILVYRAYDDKKPFLIS